MNELTELFLDELADILNAENLLLKALPKMAKAAQSEELQEAFEEHLEQTKEQIERLQQVFKTFGKPVKSKKCEAMIGLVEEGKTVMEEWKGSPALDAALIASAQKIEHYEIASYGCLCTWAKLLENDQALKLLKQTIDEEETADQKLTAIAEESINLQAAEEVEEEVTPRKIARTASRASSRKSGNKKQRLPTSNSRR